MTNRLQSYQQDKVNEMRQLHKNKEERLAQEYQPFKPCKGSQKIVKTLLEKEKEYGPNVHERLYNKKHSANKDIESIIAKANARESKMTASEAPKIKYTTDLSNTIEIHKRLGVEHLLPQKDYNKAAAVKKMEEERKARREFEEMVKQHNREVRNNTINKSKTTNKGTTLNKSVMSSRTGKSTLKANKTIAPTKAKPAQSNQSNKYLYKKLCTEFDQHITEIREEEPETEVMNKDHMRVVLVKSGFIGNDINNITEIQNDENMLEEIWRILKGPENGKVLPQNLKTFCGIIQGLIEPVGRKDFTDDSSLSHPSTAQEESDHNLFGTFNKNGTFALKNKKEKNKISKRFARLAANRNKFIRDKIKEKQMEKIKPTETFVPTINRNSAMIEQRKLESQPHRAPRYEVLLEMGRIYNLEREQKQQAYENEGDAFMTPDGELIEEMVEIQNSNAEQQEALKKAIKDIKEGKYKQDEKEYVQEPQQTHHEEREQNEYIDHEG